MFFATNYLVGLLFLFNKNVIILLFGEKWIEAHYYFVFLILSGLFLPIGYLTLSTIGGSGNAKLVLKLKLITKGILMLNFVFGFAFGIKGFLIGLICVNALNYFIELYFLNSLFSLPNIKIIRNQLEILTINFVIVLLINFVQIDFYLNSNFLILIIGTTIYSFLFVLSAFFFKLEALYYIIDEIPFLKNFQFRKEKFFKFFKF